MTSGVITALQGSLSSPVFYSDPDRRRGSLRDSLRQSWALGWRANVRYVRHAGGAEK